MTITESDGTDSPPHYLHHPNYKAWGGCQLSGKAAVLLLYRAGG